MGDVMPDHAMSTRQQSFPEPVIPPGLTEATMTDLVLSLPHGRGAVCLAGYYQHGRDHIVVYDVLDEQGTRVSDIRGTFPRQHPVVAPGTVYPLGTAEAEPTRAPSDTR
jgi:hypothetical protein